jgi:DNA-binding protein
MAILKNIQVRFVNAHGRPEGTAKRNFTQHKDKFVENVHYYLIKLTENEIRTQFGTTKNASEITVLNQKGYLKLTKSFTDDLSWDIQDMLIDSYFELNTIKAKVDNNLPVVKQDIAPINQFDFMKAMFGCIETNHHDIENLKNQNELQAQEIRETKQELQKFKSQLKKIAQ